MSRRAATLALVALLAVAGCVTVGPLGVGGGPGTPAETLTPVPVSTGGTPAGTDTPHADPGITPGAGTGCTPVSVETVDPERKRVTPSPLPDRPGTLTAETVGDYVADYETAYKRNLELSANTREYEVTVREVDVEPAGEGFVVRIDAWQWGSTADPHPGTETATVVHADGPAYAVAYYVTDRYMTRATAGYGETPDPAAGEVVECWTDATG